MNKKLHLLASIFFLISPSLLAQKKAKIPTISKVNLPEANVTAKVSKTSARVRAINRADLDFRQSRSLGETLSSLPGVQNNYFGPNAGMPVIRSLSGNRVKILLDGLAVNDLSGISPNISVFTDMDNLESVDVYTGEAAVLYGGKAIGGAVNMRGNTIPKTSFEKQLSGNAKLEAGSNSGSSQSFDLKGNSGKRWSWRLGASHQANKDLKIPGNTKAPIAFDPGMDALTEAMAQVKVHKETIRNLSLYPYISQFVLQNLNNPEWGLSEADLYTFEAFSVIGGQSVANPRNDKYIAGQDPSTPLSTTVIKGIEDYGPVKKGLMPNSHAESNAFQAGASYHSKNYYLGAGFRGSSGYYGVPGYAQYKLAGHSHDTQTVQAEYLPINTRSISNTLMLEGEIKPQGGSFSRLSLNYLTQYSDDRELVGIYQANKFMAKKYAVRVEAEQKAWGPLRGLSGIDFSSLYLKTKGSSSYLPTNMSREIGLFTSQRLVFKQTQLDLGYRYDRVQRRAMPDKDYKRSRGLSGGELRQRDFHLHQLSAGLQWRPVNFVYLKGSVRQTERAPDVNELYSGNNHFAIMLEENGDDRLEKERARTYEVSTGMELKGLHINVSYYHTDFSNYLYLAHTGISRSGGFLVKEWRASDTEITGWEAEVTLHKRFHKLDLEAGSFFDLVKNRNASDNSLRKWAEGDYMPNMPTSRFSFFAATSYNSLSLRASFERYLKQRYLGKNINPEPPMPAYSILVARIAYKTHFRMLNFEYYLSGNNLLNIEARPQNSFLKYIAPLPGRNVSLGIKAEI